MMILKVTSILEGHKNDTKEICNITQLITDQCENPWKKKKKKSY